MDLAARNRFMTGGVAAKSEIFVVVIESSCESSDDSSVPTARAFEFRPHCSYDCFLFANLHVDNGIRVDS